MQYIKTRKALVFGLAPLLFFLGIILFCYLPRFITVSFTGFWIATLCAFFLVVTPLGNHRLSHATDDIITRIPTGQWIFSIVLLELSLFGVFLGFCNIAGNTLTINTTRHPDLFLQSLQTELLHYGLFPWSWYALIAVGMGILAYRQQYHAYFSNLLRPLIKTDLQSALSVLVNVGARRLTLFGIGLTLSFLPILIISIFPSPEKHIATGFQPVALLVTLLLLFATFSDTIKHYLMRLFSRHIPTFLNLPIFGITLALILIVLNAMIKGIIPTGNQPAPLFIQNWINYHWKTAWQIFSMMWWIALTPAISAYFVRISRGYRIREILLCASALPIAITLFLFYMHNHIPTLSAQWISVLSLMAFFIALPLLVNYTHLSTLIFAYYPKNGEMKIRDHHPFFTKVAQICILGLYFYLVIGVNGISLFIFSCNYFWLISLFVAGVAIVKNAQVNAHTG